MKETVEPKETRDFFTEDEIELPITLKGHTMTFFMREVFSDEMDELDKAFAGKTEDQRKELTNKHQAKMLAMLCTKPPKNPLPGFPELTANFQTELYDFLTDYSGGKVAEKKKKDFITALTNLYSRAVSAEEFFRGV